MKKLESQLEKALKKPPNVQKLESKWKPGKKHPENPDEKVTKGGEVSKNCGS